MKKCQCHFCTYQKPIYDKYKDTLPQEVLDLIGDIWKEAESNSTELGCLHAKLNGDWPGFESYEARLSLIKT